MNIKLTLGERLKDLRVEQYLTPAAARWAIWPWRRSP